MPPVDHIKKLEVDPYTLQVESDRDDLSGYGEEGADLVASPERSSNEKNNASWWMRKPDNRVQGSLNTGYE